MATRSTTPSLLQGPTSKEKKYDRQLRLWAANGQKALEEASVLLLNAGAGVVGIETLKNLILPGVGSFTLVDEKIVSQCDLGVNFFLTEESLGRSRAEESSKYLKELNPEVYVYAIQEPIEVYVNRKDALDEYSLIIVIGPPKSLSVLQKISDYASRRSIPLFYVHSLGFYSHFSVQLPSQFPVVDTHPDPASTQDLRLLNPWPELLDFVHAKTDDLQSLDDHEHGHVPYLLLLLHYLESWGASHDGNPPANYNEKKAFKGVVQDGARKDNTEGGEENFDEAVASVLKSLNPPAISSGLRDVFEANDCKLLKPDSANFWVIAHAIREFHSSHGTLPLPGALPDMKAKSADYIQLQNIYKAKAREDLAEVTCNVRSLERETQRESTVDEQEIEAFCKGSAFVKLIKGRPIQVPIQVPNGSIPIDWTDRAKSLCQELQNEESLLPIYLSFLAYDSFLEYQKNLPPRNNEEPVTEQLGLGWENFATGMIDVTNSFLHSLQASGGEFDTGPCKAKIERIVAEFGRADGAELHNISALTGGMVAQEVIKVLTKQYIPVDNTCVFDGITSKAAVF